MSLINLREGKLTHAGTDLHYLVYGQGLRRVVLLHGWGCGSSTMQPVGEALQQDLQVLAVDFPPFGESGRPAEPWGVPEYAAALRALLEQEHFTPCSVIAHSFGARVAIWLASEDAALFDRLILTGAAGLKKAPSEESRRRSERYRRVRKALETAGKVPFLKKAAERGLEAAVQKYGSADYRALDPEMRKTFVKVISLDLADRLPRIAQPTLLIWGESDTETPLSMGEAMEKAIPDAGLVKLPGGHFAFAEQLNRFNVIARYFLLNC